jgi:hypothetical protein
VLVVVGVTAGLAYSGFLIDMAFPGRASAAPPPS